MEFSRWKSLRKAMGVDDRADVPALLADKKTPDIGVKSVDTHVTMIRIAVHEERHDRCGHPYFRVFPNMLSQLVSAEMHVPFSRISVPFDCFEIAIPKGDDTITLGGNRCYSMLVSFGDPSAGSERHRSERKELAVICQLESGDMYMISLTDRPGCSTIEQSISEMAAAGKFDHGGESSIRVIRLALSVAFLSTGSDKSVVPHVLSKHRKAWLEARTRRDVNAMREIEAKAKANRRQIGFSVGELEAERPIYSVNSDSTGESGKSLSFSHKRRAHFRVTKLGKIAFVRMHTVRPDLPPSQKIPVYNVA
jgi:hypothetical protein